MNDIDRIYDPKATSVPVLRYLVAVAAHRHFGRAAEACFVTQPTLSAQIAKWERAMGLVVFERHAHGADVTPAGEAIVARAREALDALAAVERAAEGAEDPLAGHLRLGLIPTVAPGLLPLLLPATRRAHPELELGVVEDTTDHLLAELRAHRIDLAVMALPVAMDGLLGEALYDEAFIAAVPAKHPLAERKALRAEEVAAALPLLLLAEGHCLRDQALSACRQPPRADRGADLRATSLATLRQLVAAGGGATLLPALEAGGRQKGIALRPLSGGEHRRIALLWRATDPRGEAYRTVAVTWRAALPDDVVTPCADVA